MPKNLQKPAKKARTNKRAASDDTQIRYTILEAALNLAEELPWKDLTLAQIAKACRMPTGQVTSVFATVDDIILSIMPYFDAAVADDVGAIDINQPVHDRLFDVIMTRFDLLQKHRQAVLNCINAARQSPTLLNKLGCQHITSMQKILHVAGIEVDPAKRLFALAGLELAYMQALWIWQKDTSPDMSKTRASLDRNLRFANKIAAILLRR